MKKVTITYYTHDDDNTSLELFNLVSRSCTSCKELIRLNENIVEPMLLDTDYLVFSASGSIDNFRIFEIAHVDDTNKESLYNEYDSENDCYSYRRIRMLYNDYIKDLDFIPIMYRKVSLNGVETEESKVLGGVTILNQNDPKHIEFLEREVNVNLNNIGRLSLMKINGDKLIAVVKPIEKIFGMRLLREKNRNYYQQLDYFLGGKYCSKEDIANELINIEEAKELIKERVNDWPGVTSYRKLIFTVILQNITNEKSLIFNYESGDSILTFDEIYELLKTCIKNFEKQEMLNEILKTVQKFKDENRVYAMPFIKRIFEEYDMFDKDLLELSNNYNDSEDFFGKFLFKLSQIFDLAVLKDSTRYSFLKSETWFLNITDAIATGIRKTINELKNEFKFKNEWEKLKEEQIEEIKSVFKILISRTFICKEIGPSILYISRTMSEEEVGSDFIDFFMNLLVEILNEYKGREVFTVRSIVKNESFDLIFGYGRNYVTKKLSDYTTKEHTKLRKIIFECHIE